MFLSSAALKTRDIWQESNIRCFLRMYKNFNILREANIKATFYFNPFYYHLNKFFSLKKNPNYIIDPGFDLNWPYGSDLMKEKQH